VIPFSITIPEGAEAGGYFAAIFFGTQNPDLLGTGEIAVGGENRSPRAPECFWGSK
jgi:hypothetical protein